MNLLTRLFVVVLSFHFSSQAFSQEIDPRAYSNLPVNSNFGVLNYTFTTGNIVSDPAAPIKELELDANSVALGYVRTFGIGGNLARIQIVAPYTFLAGTAKLQGRDTSGTRSGLSDARIRFGYNFIGSPALSLKDFPKFRDETIVGASLVVSVPIGQYYSERLINLGTNRWGFKPEIGFSKRFGELYGEIYTGVWFFTDNNEYIVNKTLETSPLFNIQMQINYIFPNKMWAGVDAGYSNGGNTKVNGVSNDAKQDNWRLGGVFSTPLSRSLAAKIQFHTGAAVRRGSDFDFYSLGLTYFWQ